MSIINNCMFVASAVLNMVGLNVVPHKPDPIHSFGEHDRANTKGLFAEMMQNHTGTKTEMFYRTAGAFELLEECRQTCQRDPGAVKDFSARSDQCFVFGLYDTHRVERSIREHNALISDPQLGISEINTLLQKTFQNACKEYKGAGLHAVHPVLCVGIGLKGSFDCCTNKNNSIVRINLQELLQLRNIALEYKKMVGEKYSGKEYISILLRPSLNGLKGAIFHELSHPISSSLQDIATREQNNAVGFGKFEAYTNTLAVLNSPSPIDTARDLCTGYHSDHLPGLIGALEAEQSQRRGKKAASVKGYLTQKGEYDPAVRAARFILSEQAIL